MRYPDLLEAIAPKGSGLNLEPIDDYRARVRPLLPNWPDCPLRQWPHRHWCDFRRTWAWLEVEGLEFHQESWPTNRILAEVRAVGHQQFVVQAQAIANDPSRREGWWLWEQVSAHGTWPVPILVLRYEGEFRSHDRVTLHRPYTLLEGHKRLECFLALNSMKSAAIASEHDVWLVRARPSKVRRRYEP